VAEFLGRPTSKTVMKEALDKADVNRNNYFHKGKAMPIKACELDGKPGYQYGDGECHTYAEGDAEGKEAARGKAEAQGRAIEAGKVKKGGTK